MKRADILASVNRMVDDLADPRCYGADGESQHLEIERLLGMIDWGRVPTPSIRRVLSAIVSELPMKRLTTGSRCEVGGFVGQIAQSIKFNESLREEQRVAEYLADQQRGAA